MEEGFEVNLYELTGTLKVSMVQIQHIPMIKMRNEGTGTGPETAEKGIGSPYFKVQVGSYQFDFLEPVHEQEEEDGEQKWVMKWKKEFVFELSGDMRELSFQLFNWKLSFQDGALGTIKIPMGELVSEKWAGKQHDMHSFLEDPHHKGEPLQGPNKKSTFLEFSVLYQPERTMQTTSSSEEASSALSSTGGGATIKCRMCSRKIFLPRRMAPALRTQVVRKAAKPRRFTWLRNYNIEEPVVVTKIEVPRELFALPRLLAQLPSPMNNFLLHALQDWELASRLRQETSINNFPNLNHLVPLYAGGPGDGLEEAIAVAMWGVQDKAAELRAVTRDLVREEEYTERLWRVWQREFRTQRRRFEGRGFRADAEQERKHWEQVLAELESHREHASHLTSAATTALRLLALAHVIERPLVVVLDKAQEEGFPPTHLEPQDHGVAVLERWALGGVYVPLLAAESRGSTCPVPLALAAHTLRFSALVAVVGEESPLAHALPDPPLLPLFSAGWLFPLPFCHVNKEEAAGRAGGGVWDAVLGIEAWEAEESEETVEAREEREKEWRTLSTKETEEVLLAWLECASSDQEPRLLKGVAASRRPTFSTNHLSLPAGARPLLAVLHTAEAKPDFLQLLPRFVLLGLHLLMMGQRHGGKELCWMEMADYLELHRPWQEHPDPETQEAVRTRMQEAAGSQKDLLGADPDDKRHEVVMDRYLHMLLYLASFIKIDHFDVTMKALREFEHTQLASRRVRPGTQSGNLTF